MFSFLKDRNIAVAKFSHITKNCVESYTKPA